MIETQELCVSDFAGNVCRKSKISIAGGINKNFAGDFNLARFAIGNNAFDFIIFFHAVYYMCSIEYTTTRLKYHIFKHRLAELRLNYGQVGLHYCMAFGIQPFEPFFADAVNNTGNARYISVGAKAAQGLTYFKKYRPFPRPGRGYGSRAAPGAAAAYNHICVKLFACCKHSLSPFDNNVRIPLRPQSRPPHSLASCSKECGFRLARKPFLRTKGYKNSGCVSMTYVLFFSLTKPA